MKTVLVRSLPELPSGVTSTLPPAAYYNNDVALHRVMLLRHTLKPLC